MNKVPVILDTDIGGDIDDAWALALILQCPEIELKMVLSASGDTTYRAKVLAKTLSISGRSDIPVGIGKETILEGDMQTVKEWVKDYRLEDYPGVIHEDGIGAMIELIEQSPEPVTILNIASLSNIAEALDRAPEIAGKCCFTGMHGSLYKAYGNKPGRSIEFNVKADIDACRKVFNAPWIKATITPLDTCGNVVVDGEIYKKIYSSKKKTIRALFEQYALWHAMVKADWDISLQSSNLFDTVAVFLVFSESFMRMEKLGISVSDEGYTIPDSQAGNNINAAVEWIDLDGFKEWLGERLLK